MVIMTDYDFNAQSYNKYTYLPQLSANCINYLIENDDEVWKLLYYTDANAWDETALTKTQKRALIYDGSTDITKFRVFMDSGQDDSFLKEVCLLRICPIELNPTNYVYGNVIMAFEVYAHYKINQLSNYTTRIDSIAQKIIEVFNGAEKGGLGRLYFDARAYSRTRAFVIGAIPFKGKAILMCNFLAG
jgi:hypothetical protein